MKNLKKTTGKIIAVLTLLLTVAVFVFSAHYSGETKAAERYFDALDRKDQTAFNKYSERPENVNTVRDFYIRISGLSDSEDPDSISFKVEFPSGATIKPGGDNYRLPIKLTVYDDNDHHVFTDTVANMTYIGKKWRVLTIGFE